MPSFTDCGNASASTFRLIDRAVVGSIAAAMTSRRRNVLSTFASSPNVSKEDVSALERPYRYRAGLRGRDSSGTLIAIRTAASCKHGHYCADHYD